MARPSGGRRTGVAIAILAAIAIAAVYILRARSRELVLTGIVTTDDVIVSPLVTGQIEKLLVKEADLVTPGQLLAVLAPGELAAERAFFSFSAQGMAGQIEENEATLRYQERQTEQQIRQAEATLAAVEAQRAEAQANLENATSNARRVETLQAGGATTEQDMDQARTTLAVAKARLGAVQKQLEAQRAAIGLARANAEQVSARRAALAAIQSQGAAAKAQADKAGVRLAYTEIRSPLAGVVDVRAARAGEVVTAGQPIVTLIDPDDLWVRVDVEEGTVGAIRIGDQLRVRLPSGEERPGTVFFRGVDAGFATQRDVSRTKRDIKTFEIRLRLDNHDRCLAVGMTAYVILPEAA